MTSLIRSSSSAVTKVLIGRRSSGGVWMTDRSRMPASAICNVRGIGVADSERTSTEARSCLSFSFCITPNRCSSSRTTRPRSLKRTSFCSSRWVPITTSTSPTSKRRRTSVASASERKRDSMSTLTGNGWKRSRKVRKCCWASTVVGTRTATCLPSITALNAARTASSVLPKPTSPQRRRSMGRESSMNRLLCGDVGFGKTELAVRAAFKAVMDGKQVAVLVPTTVLAQQHYLTFRDRFQPFPVKVDMLSRFRSDAEATDVLRRLLVGEVDVVIGTHRLLQKDVRFKDLGLVVLDEEQRFGVMQKEKLKQLRASVDVLSLSATPIPRTLHMALAGIRDLSVIQTPPE